MIDRPAAIRRAVRTLVARNGFHGASMADVARRAGVATGTAYVHYPSKDELMFATYLELRRELGDAAAANIDADRPAEQRFVQLWCGVHDHLVADPDRAAFLVQFDASPYAGEGNADRCPRPTTRSGSRPTAPTWRVGWSICRSRHCTTWRSVPSSVRLRWAMCSTKSNGTRSHGRAGGRSRATEHRRCRVGRIA